MTAAETQIIHKKNTQERISFWSEILDSGGAWALVDLECTWNWGLHRAMASARRWAGVPRVGPAPPGCRNEHPRPAAAKGEWGAVKHGNLGTTEEAHAEPSHTSSLCPGPRLGIDAPASLRPA